MRVAYGFLLFNYEEFKMANRDSTFGARFIGHLQGNSVSASSRTYTVLATDAVTLFVGDFVTHQGDSALGDDGLYHPVAAQSAASDKITGFVISVNNSRDYENQIYRTASTLRTIEVCDDRSEEHTSELQSHSFISYAVFCLKKKKKKN